MKKLIFMIAALSLVAAGATAQIGKQKTQTPKEQKERDWYNCSFDKDGVYGADVNRAYEFVKDKKAKTTPVIAIIGGGLDFEHEALKANVWTNPKEKADGKDNDKNGYVDDFHGWNFLGGKNGVMMEKTLREGDREFLRIGDKYKDIIFDGENYFVYKDGKRVKVTPENMEEYDYYRHSALMESKIGATYGGYNFANVLKEYAIKYDKEMRQRSPDKEKYGTLDLSSCWDKTGPQDSLGNIAMFMMGIYFNMNKVDNWEKVYNNYVNGKQFEVSKQSYDDAVKNLGSDGRKEIVGDNFLDINDKIYGNNVLLTAESTASTMTAGIIAGKRGIEGRNNPISEKAQIMPLVVTAKSGEPYLKDMALAMRYAVDNGASVIILPQQNTLYPPYSMDWINDAMEYAQTKGVLVVVGAWELSHDLSQETFFPNRWMIGGKELTNLIVVSSSDANGNPSLNSNYGAKELDLYAPGVKMFSAYIGDAYQAGSGSMLSAASVAGVAALIKTYYPKLTGSQIRTIIIESVTSRKGAEVEKGILVNGKNTQDIFLFDQLCLSGGILNAYNAIQLADKIASKK